MSMSLDDIEGLERYNLLTHSTFSSLRHFRFRQKGSSVQIKKRVNEEKDDFAERLAIISKRRRHA